MCADTNPDVFPRLTSAAACLRGAAEELTAAQARIDGDPPSRGIVGNRLVAITGSLLAAAQIIETIHNDLSDTGPEPITTNPTPEDLVQ